jgi:LemA protein
VDSFPSNLVAKVFGFKKEIFFELEEKAANEPVKVSF